MHKHYPDSVPIGVLVLVGCILLFQSLWLFRNARRHTKYYWFWGVIGLIHFPTPLIVYWFIYIYLPRRKGRNKDRLH
jgi:dolichyl-phosphate-mannose--protein O-mannosyl transferase